MPILSHRAPPVKPGADAIDREPITGKARNDFEASLHAKVKRSHQLVLRILLDFAGGKAECWPGNKRVAEIAGYEVRNVQYILRALEAAKVIRCAVDRSLPTQRRIVILDHPNAVRVLLRLGDRPWLHLGVQETARKAAENVHLGVQNHVGVGVQNHVGAGVQNGAPDFPLDSNSETRIPGFSPSFERPKPRPRHEQIAFLEARIAAGGA
jgi:hypothetical protein